MLLVKIQSGLSPKDPFASELSIDSQEDQSHFSAEP